MDNILLLPIKLDELESIIKNSVKQALDDSHETRKNDSRSIASDLLDVKQASAFLNLAVPTVYALVSSRRIVSYKRGKKLYFKKTELEQWINSGKRSSVSELTQKAKDLTRA